MFDEKHLSNLLVIEIHLLTLRKIFYSVKIKLGVRIYQYEFKTTHHFVKVRKNIEQMTKYKLVDQSITD